MATSEAEIKQEMEAHKFGTSKGQAWFCTTGLPSDVVIEVDDMSFHLHKFPLMSKSRKLHQLINEQEHNSRPGGNEECEEGETEEGETHHITLPEFPGGSEAFEVAAKFCYGVKIDLTPWNVAPLRCAAEYLDMAEDYSEDNLVSRTERFLAQSVLRGLKESLQTLKSCEDLMPLAEELGIVRRCIESIAARACSSDPGSLFGWPVNERGTSGGDPIPIPILWNGIDTGAPRRRSGTRSSSVTTAAGSWLEDLAILSLPIYKRVIDAMRAADPRSEVLEGSLVSYAKRSIPGLSRSSRKHASAPIASEAEQRELLETVIANLPVEKNAGGLTTAKFLFRLLRTVNILRASEETRTTLERRIASQLEQATVDDLLMPSYSYLTETLYDVDCAERILGYFLEGLEERSAITAAELPEDGHGDGGARLTRVGKLVDGYLAEIASDANLKPDRFCDLALAIPGHARVYDDGLYRAVDVYLKAHPGMGEEEREKVCGVMECQKLTLEACTHAAQNERLPLRAVVQVLFFEQLQLRRAIAGTLLSAEPQGERRSPSAAGEGETWRSAVRENQVLRLDMDSMRNRVHELERECSTMRKKIERIDRGAGAGAGAGPQAGGDTAAGGWGSFTRKFGCKFKTQVCDSHERTVVESRRRDPAERSP